MRGVIKTSTTHAIMIYWRITAFPLTKATSLTFSKARITRIYSRRVKALQIEWRSRIKSGRKIFTVASCKTKRGVGESDKNNNTPYWHARQLTNHPRRYYLNLLRFLRNGQGGSTDCSNVKECGRWYATSGHTTRATGAEHGGGTQANNGKKTPLNDRQGKKALASKFVQPSGTSRTSIAYV
jgi:hypothetical protein